MCTFSFACCKADEGKWLIICPYSLSHLITIAEELEEVLIIALSVFAAAPLTIKVNHHFPHWLVIAPVTKQILSRLPLGLVA